MRLYLKMEEIGVPLLAPGYDRILQTMAAAARTGHNVTLPDAIWVVVSFFLFFFLPFECDVEAGSVFEEGIVVVYGPTIFEELKVSEWEDFGLLFFLL